MKLKHVKRVLRFFPWSPALGIPNTARDRFLYLFCIEGYTIAKLAELIGSNADTLESDLITINADFDDCTSNMFVDVAAYRFTYQDLRDFSSFEVANIYKEETINVIRAKVRRGFTRSEMPKAINFHKTYCTACKHSD